MYTGQTTHIVNGNRIELHQGDRLFTQIIRSGGYAAIGEYYISKTNGLLPEGLYTFGEDGKMIL